MNWWEPSTPDEITPSVWMHPAAVLYLDSLLRSDMTVFEHGCGGSTLWLAKRCRDLHSYETDKEWYEKVAHKFRGNEFVFVHRKPTPPVFPDMRCDLLLIDGSNRDRPIWIAAAPSLVKPGGIVVVDNSERPHYQDALESLSRKCVKPLHVTGYATGLGNKLVQTSFYRLQGGENWI